jgi:hypothetical protein
MSDQSLIPNDEFSIRKEDDEKYDTGSVKTVMG